jgi:hypothetical protein
MTRTLAQQLESGARPAHSSVGMPSSVVGYLSRPISLWPNDHAIEPRQLSVASRPDHRSPGGSRHICSGQQLDSGV